MVDHWQLWDPSALVGTVLGRYELERLIGQGGMGAVFAARHLELGRHAAVKVLRPRQSESDDSQRRFLREGRAGSRIRHRNIVDVYDVGSEAGLLYLVMELLEGEDLRALLRREQRLGVERAADLLVPVVAALSAAHALGVVHRDLKPENLFLARQHTVLVPKVLDFGISKLDDAELSDVLTNPSSLLGTPFYLSPEQVLSSSEVDARSDQYALGVVLYECLLGQRPVEEAKLYPLIRRIAEGDLVPPRQRDPALPSRLEELLLRALARDPAQRFADTRALGRALLEFASPRVRSNYEEELATGGDISAAAPAPAPGLAAGAATTALAPREGSTLGQELPALRSRPGARRPRLLAAGLAIAGLSAAALLGWRLREPGVSSIGAALHAAPELRLRMLTSFSAENMVQGAALAADGQRYLYTVGEGAWLASVDGSEPPRRLEQLDATNAVISLMPDGATAIVLSTQTEPALDPKVIELWPVGGREPRRLSLHSDCTARDSVLKPVVPSPDGSALLVHCSGKLLVVDVASGESRRIADWFGERTVASSAWSPDGSHFAVITRGSVMIGLPELSIWSANGAKSIRLLSDRGLINSRMSSDGGLAWLDERRLLYSRLNDASQQPGSALLELQLDENMSAVGPPRVLQRYAGQFVSSLSIARGSRRAIAVVNQTQGDVLVADLNVAAGKLDQIQRLTLEDGDDRPGTWLPDGRVAFMSNRWGSWDIFAQAPGSADVELLAGSEAWETWPGRLGPSLAFWRFPSSPVNGARSVQLVTLGGQGIERVVLDRSMEEEMLHESAPPPFTTRFDCGGPEHSLCVVSQVGPLPAGSSGLLFSRLDPQTGAIGAPFHTRVGGDEYWSLAPDGTQVALVGPNGSGLSVVSLTGQSREVPLPPRLWQSVRWLPDGKGVLLTGMAVSSAEYIIASADLDGKTNFLHTSDSTWFTQPAPSPDGKQVAFGALYYEQNLQLIEGW